MSDRHSKKTRGAYLTALLLMAALAGCPREWDTKEGIVPEISISGADIDTESEWNSVFAVHSTIVLQSGLALSEDALFVIPPEKVLDMNGHSLTISTNARLVIAGQLKAEASLVNVQSGTIVVIAESGTVTAADTEREGLFGVGLVNFLPASRAENAVISEGGYIIGDITINADTNVLNYPLTVIGSILVESGKLTIAKPLISALGSVTVSPAAALVFKPGASLAGSSKVTVKEGGRLQDETGGTLFSSEKSQITLENGSVFEKNGAYYAGSGKISNTDPVFDMGTTGSLVLSKGGMTLNREVEIMQDAEIAAPQTLKVMSVLTVLPGKDLAIKIGAKLAGAGALLVKDGALLHCEDNSDDGLWGDNNVGVIIEYGAKAYLGSAYFVGSVPVSMVDPVLELRTPASKVNLKRGVIEVIGDADIKQAVPISPVHTVIARNTVTLTSGALLLFKDGAKFSGSGKIVAESGAMLVNSNDKAAGRTIWAADSTGSIVIKHGASYYEGDYQINYMRPVLPGNDLMRIGAADQRNLWVKLNASATITLQKNVFLLEGSADISEGGWTIDSGASLQGAASGAQLSAVSYGLTFYSGSIIPGKESFGAPQVGQTWTISGKTLVWNGASWQAQ